MLLDVLHPQAAVIYIRADIICLTERKCDVCDELRSLQSLQNPVDATSCERRFESNDRYRNASLVHAKLPHYLHIANLLVTEPLCSFGSTAKCAELSDVCAVAGNRRESKACLSESRVHFVLL